MTQLSSGTGQIWYSQVNKGGPVSSKDCLMGRSEGLTVVPPNTSRYDRIIGNTGPILRYDRERKEVLTIWI